MCCHADIAEPAPDPLHCSTSFERVLAECLVGNRVCQERRAVWRVLQVSCWAWCLKSKLWLTRAFLESTPPLLSSNPIKSDAAKSDGVGFTPRLRLDHTSILLEHQPPTCLHPQITATLTILSQPSKHPPFRLQAYV